MTHPLVVLLGHKANRRTHTHTHMDKLHRVFGWAFMSQITQVIKPQPACAALILAPWIRWGGGGGGGLMLKLAFSLLVAGSKHEQL